MNLRNLIVSGLLVTGLTVAAHAQVTSDIVIGFTAAGGTGAATNIELDFGNASNFTGASGTVALGNFNTSLTSVYGAGWNTRTDLTWGSFGGTGTVADANTPPGTVARTIWASAVGGTTGYTESQAYKYQTPNSNFTSVYNTFNSGTALTENGATTGFGTVKAIQIGTATAGSWSASGAGTTFGMGGLATGVQFQGVAGTNGLDLYQDSPVTSGSAPAKLLGTFALSSTGALTFTATAVPEPSTYAAILGLAALGFVMIRRRQQGFAS